MPVDVVSARSGQDDAHLGLASRRFGHSVDAASVTGIVRISQFPLRHIDSYRHIFLFVLNQRLH